MMNTNRGGNEGKIKDLWVFKACKFTQNEAYLLTYGFLLLEHKAALRRRWHGGLNMRE